MDFGGIALIVRTLETYVRMPKRPSLGRISASITKQPLQLVGGTAAIHEVEISGGVVASVKLRNKDLVLHVRYSFATPDKTVIRETFEISFKDSPVIRTIIFERDEVIEIDGRDSKKIRFFEEFYAEQIRRIVHEDRGASKVLALGWSPPIEDWRSKPDEMSEM